MFYWLTSIITYFDNALYMRGRIENMMNSVEPLWLDIDGLPIPVTERHGITTRANLNARAKLALAGQKVEAAHFFKREIKEAYYLEIEVLR